MDEIGGTVAMLENISKDWRLKDTPNNIYEYTGQQSGVVFFKFKEFVDGERYVDITQQYISLPIGLVEEVFEPHT